MGESIYLASKQTGAKTHSYNYTQLLSDVLDKLYEYLSSKVTLSSEMLHP